MGKYGINYNVKYLLSILNYRLIIKILIKLYARGAVMSTELFIKIILVILTCFLFVYILVPVVKKIAEHVGAMDMPNARKVHKVPIPRLGGLAIFAGFLFGYLIFGKQNDLITSIERGRFIIVITGMIDDIKPLDA